MNRNDERGLSNGAGPTFWPTRKLVVDGVSKWFRTPRTTMHALDNISIEVSAGEVVCIVGPSGCGKSTLPGDPLGHRRGTFVPAMSLLAMKQALRSSFNELPSLTILLSPREAAIAEALCRGKPNKIIAYELNLCERTVKVHIRSIMKKLKATATNRTRSLTRSTTCSGRVRDFDRSAASQRKCRDDPVPPLR